MDKTFDQIPQFINPWKFAENYQQGLFNLKIEDTQELKKLKLSNREINFFLRGFIDDYKQKRLYGEFSFKMQGDCQRCLHDMDYTVEHQFDYVLLHNEKQEDSVLGGVESFVFAESELDLQWFLEEEVLLSIPMVIKHIDCELPQKLEKNTDKNTYRPFANLKNMIKE